MTFTPVLTRPLVWSALLVAGCSLTDTTHIPPPSGPAPASAAVSTAEALTAFRRAGETSRQAGYLLGAGDVISVDVWGREDLSSKQVIGPDGTVTLPVVGDLQVGGLDRSQALAAIQQQMARAYPDLAITLRVENYNSLRIVVLGQVRSPGAHVFAAQPDLLGALGAAGGVNEPAQDLTPKDAALAAAAETRSWKAAVIRGRDAVLWVDLGALLREGDMSLNVPLIAGDIVHVSAAALPMVYVLGEVTNPGIYPLRAGATVLDALALAGGTTKDSNDEGVRLLRPVKNQHAGFDYQAYQSGEFEYDLPLAAGDVVYVPTSLIGEVGYFLSQLSPLAQMLIFTQVITD